SSDISRFVWGGVVKTFRWPVQMHPLIESVHGHIRSLSYKSPTQLMNDVAVVLSDVLTEGDRPDNSAFEKLLKSVTSVQLNDVAEIPGVLRTWDALTDEDELRTTPDDDDRSLSFKVGVVWVVGRSLMLYFNPNEKLNSFEEWQDFACSNIVTMCGIFLPK
ncbi:hypothetical protein, partial [Rhodopirellula europaea]